MHCAFNVKITIISKQLNRTPYQDCIFSLLYNSDRSLIATLQFRLLSKMEEDMTTGWREKKRWTRPKQNHKIKKGKGSPYSITERRVPELIPVLGSQSAGDVSHKHGGRLLLLSARPAVTPASLKRAATNFAAWWTEARWVWTVCVETAIWTQAILRLSSLGYRATKYRWNLKMQVTTYACRVSVNLKQLVWVGLCIKS